MKNDIVATDNHLTTTLEMFTSPKEKDLKQVSTRCEMFFFAKTHSELPSGKLTWLAGKWTRIEDVFPIENGDIPLLC